MEENNCSKESKMLGFSSRDPISEHEASGAIERVYHEIKQTLRVTGVNLNFRTWGSLGAFLPLIWDTLQPAVETLNFEIAADSVRAEAGSFGESLGSLNVPSHDVLGESQLFQLRGSLDLYHYVNPKLLVFTSAVAMLLRGEEIGREFDSAPDRIARGAPRDMLDMDMEDDQSEEPLIVELYDDIKQTLSLTSINSDYRTLALWPNYLSVAWQQLKPVVKSTAYHRATDQLRTKSRELARTLPYPLTLDLRTLRSANVDLDKATAMTDSFEQLLPGLIINIALLQSDWKTGSELKASPFPAQKRYHRTGESR